MTIRAELCQNQLMPKYSTVSVIWQITGADLLMMFLIYFRVITVKQAEQFISRESEIHLILQQRGSNISKCSVVHKQSLTETKYYVKPSNQRLYLHYRSCHPQHTFQSIVYSEALQGIMVNSREEWNLWYWRELRQKFLDQEYPIKMINSELKRALEVDRKYLLFNSKKIRRQ